MSARLDDFDATLEHLFDDNDARKAGVRRAICDIELHILCAIHGTWVKARRDDSSCPTILNLIQVKYSCANCLSDPQGYFDE